MYAFITEGPPVGSAPCDMVSVETQTDPRPRTRSTTFYVGDSSGEESDVDVVETLTMVTTETQTDESLECQLPAEPRPPRPLDECLAILKSSV